MPSSRPPLENLGLNHSWKLTKSVGASLFNHIVFLYFTNNMFFYFKECQRLRVIFLQTFHKLKEQTVRTLREMKAALEILWEGPRQIDNKKMKWRKREPKVKNIFKKIYTRKKHEFNIATYLFSIVAFFTESVKRSLQFFYQLYISSFGFIIFCKYQQNGNAIYQFENWYNCCFHFFQILMRKKLKKG